VRLNEKQRTMSISTALLHDSMLCRGSFCRIVCPRCSFRLQSNHNESIHQRCKRQSRPTCPVAYVEFKCSKMLWASVISSGTLMPAPATAALVTSAGIKMFGSSSLGKITMSVLKRFMYSRSLKRAPFGRLCTI
jgi:hypothetical protein